MKTMNGTLNGHHNRLTNGNSPLPLLKPQKPSGDGKPASEPEPVKPSGDGDAGRGANGRFAHGNRGGKGNPFARRVAALRSALFAELTEEKLAKLAANLCDRAMKGDMAAAKLLLLYAIGKPADTVDPDRLDLDEFKLLEENPTQSETARAALDGLAATIAAHIVRDALEKRQPADVVEMMVPKDAQVGMIESLGRRYLNEQSRRVGKK